MARQSQKRQRVAKAAAKREGRRKQAQTRRWLGLGIGVVALASIVLLLGAVWPDEGADLEGADFSETAWNLPR